MDAQRVRVEYLRWFKRNVVILAVPPLSVAWGQTAIAVLPEWPAPPAGLRSMLLALAAGAVVFGRALKARAVDTTESEVAALAGARRFSRDLVWAAVSPSIVGAIIVPMTRSGLDLYLTLGFALLGCVTMFPREADWQRWLARDGARGDRT